MLIPRRIISNALIYLAFLGPFIVRAQTNPASLDEATKLLRKLSEAPANPTTKPPADTALERRVGAAESKPEGDRPAPDVRKDYVLVPNDLVRVSVFNEDNLSTESRLSSEGKINFPLIGSIKIGGRTPDEAAKLIRDLLNEDYVVNPQVNLRVIEFNKRRFTILGQVQKPGSYDIPDNQSVNLMQAISMAGGYTRIAAPSKVTVQRQENGRKVIHSLDAKSMARSKDTKVFEILGDDTITVGESIF